MINCYTFVSFGRFLMQTSFPSLYLLYTIFPSLSFALAFAAAVVRCEGGNGDWGTKIVKSLFRLQIAVYYHVKQQ